MTPRHLQRLQAHWDWRAAGNFICGGAGAGLLVFATLCAPAAFVAPLAVGGLALVALGLFFVWLEIGRPLRAPNVLVHLRTSWMSREALVALVLFALGAGLVFGLAGRAWPVALVALAFLYCQARILGAARGIPVWRHPLTVVLIVLTGLTEGLGLFWVVLSWTQPPVVLAAPLAVLLAARWSVGCVWRRGLRQDAAPAALRANARVAPWLLWAGTLAPLGLLMLAGASAFTGTAVALQAPLLAGAGLLAAASGAAWKFTLVTRMAHQQGFSLPRMPVRGVPRTAPL
jgi:phenylacetyl-CoA:acceptor oxidoreductase subunit 2